MRDSSSSELSLGNHHSGRFYLSISSDEDFPDVRTHLELRIVLDQMGLDPSEEELQDMIREVDQDQSGSISFAEFVRNTMR